MENFFQAAAEIVLTRSSESLSKVFIEKVKSEIFVNKAHILTLNHDGRLLECEVGKTSLSWSVTDFNSPFAHVVQSNSLMILKNKDLNYWQSNVAFNQLVEKIEITDDVCIIPMKIKGKQLHALLLLIDQGRKLNAISKSEDFRHLVTICVNHFQLLLEMQEKKRHSSFLSESLKDAKKENVNSHLIEKLGKTLIGDSNEMFKLKEQIINAASSHLSVMIKGDTGTGKELASKAVHDFSERSKGAFVAINCAAIPEALLESELFGYVKGAFSGAEYDKDGLLAEANGGTLFLDEIGDMPLLLQAKLLRVLESHSYRPVGGKVELFSNFRLVTATHVDLKAKVIDNLFRKDLYYRLYQYPILLPKLAIRKSDIEMLSQFFINEYNMKYKKHIRGVHFKTIDYLMQYDFPGNVRELKHIIEYGCAQTKDNEQISFVSIVDRLEINTEIERLNFPPLLKEHDFTSITDLKKAVRQYEIKLIASRLQEFHGDKGKAAQSLNIPKRTLTDKCLKLEIESYQ